MILGKPHRVIEGNPVGHQRRGGENAPGVRLDDSRIHIPRVTEVVGIDDEPLQILNLKTARV